MTHPIEQAADAVERELADLRAKLAVAVEVLGDISNEEFYTMGIGIAPQPTRAAKKARAALVQIKGDE